MNTVDARAFVLDQIPMRHRVLLPPALSAAYQAVNILIKNEPFLQIPSAHDQRGRIVSWAVDKAIETLITSGGWPVEHRWQVYGHRDKDGRVTSATGRYLEVLLSHSRLTISQVSDPAKQPRDVRFRGNARLINDPFLPELEMDAEVNGEPAILLTHGHQDLRFAHIGLPHSRHNRDYIYRSENLMMLPHELRSDIAPIERIEFVDTMTLKEEIDKWRKDHAG